MGSIKLTLGKVTPTDAMAACVAPMITNGLWDLWCDSKTVPWDIYKFKRFFIIYGKERMMQMK